MPKRPALGNNRLPKKVYDTTDQSVTDSGEALANPYIGRADYHCFACAPHNPLGLRMRFWREGRFVVCHWQPQPHYQGYHDVLHGGIQATLMDEIASWTIFVQLGVAGITTGLQIEYLSAVDTRTALTVRGSLRSADRRTALIDTTISQRVDTPCTTAICRYRLFSASLARERLGYPGPEAFRPPSANAP